MPASGPLTDAEHRQLAALDRTRARGFARFFATLALLGMLGGAVLAYVLSGPGVRFTLTERVPELAPVEAALGPTAFLYAVSMLLFGGVMSAAAWRYWAALMGTRSRLRARDASTGGRSRAV